MKKISYILPLISLILIFIFQSGCKKADEVVTPVDENIDKESVSARNMMSVGKLAAEANSYLWLYINNGDGSGCPEYYFDNVSERVIVNYGAAPGCAGADGIRRSGLYFMTFYVNAAQDSVYSPISFTDYKIYKSSAIDTNVVKLLGNLIFSSKKTSGTTYTFHASGEVLFLTNSGSTKTITLTGVNGTVNLNSTTTSADDEYLLYGTITIQDSQLNVTYTITINQTSPLKIVNSCAYPLSGVANFSSTNSSASCDFSPNGGICDAVARMTKGTFSATIDLSTINF